MIFMDKKFRAVRPDTLKLAFTYYFGTEVFKKAVVYCQRKVILMYCREKRAHMLMST